MTLFLLGFIAIFNALFFPSTLKYERISNKIVFESSKEIAEKHDLIFIGS